jgi:hypothetical protein
LATAVSRQSNFSPAVKAKNTIYIYLTKYKAKQKNPFAGPDSSRRLRFPDF